MRIDWLELAGAFEMNLDEARAWLDVETGEVVTLFDEDGDDETAARIDEKPARYAQVEPPDAREQYEWMAEFIESVADPGVQEALFAAIDARGAFRRFQDSVERWPEERDRWAAFRAERMHRAIEDWIEWLDVEVDNPPPWREEVASEESGPQRA